MRVMSYPPTASLSVLGAESILREWHHVEPPTGRVKQGLRQRGSNRRQNHFPKTLRRAIAREHDRDDLRHFVYAQQRIVGKVALLRSAAREGNPALERIGQRESDPALDLRFERVRVDHEAGIDGAEHTLDGKASRHARSLDHLRDIGFEAGAATDVTIV